MSINSKSRKLLKPAQRRATENINPGCESPESLARHLLKIRAGSSSGGDKRRIWTQLQDLGSAAVVKRAIQTLNKSRGNAEFLGVLQAVGADGWHEAGPSITKRFNLETQRLGKRTPSRDHFARIEALLSAAGSIEVNLDAQHLRNLLKHTSAKLRSMAAHYVHKMKRFDLQAELLPISSERGPAAAIAFDALKNFGNTELAATVWPRVLAARKSGNHRLLHHYLNLLGSWGAFDTLIAVRVWAEEDFLKSEEDGWRLAESWSGLVRAKLAAGECSRNDALNDLRWFLHNAEMHAIPELKFDGEGVFHLARGFALLDAKDEAEALALRASKRSLPNPEKFPELLEMARRSVAAGLAPTTWLAAAGDIDAQRKVVENWPVLLRDGRKPVNWDMRGLINVQVMRETLLEALNSPSAAAVRRVLKFISGDDCAWHIVEEISRLSANHPSATVRWKADRVAARAMKVSEPRVERNCWVRVDAAVLSGAVRKVDEPRKTVVRVEKTVPGIVAPERAGYGWKLAVEKLRAKERREVVQSILKAPLARALHRRAPLGPAFEERPDVRAVREMAKPSNAVDEQMIEMAQAVMEFWVYGEEPLTLDINGVLQIAAFLSTAGVTMDDDDVIACGAFIGETLRKRLGGEWSGFDGQYSLHIGSESFDPISLAKRIFQRKDPAQGPMAASEMLIGAEARLSPPRRKTTPNGAPRDTGASFERAIRALCELPINAPMSALMSEMRVFTYRMEPTDWSAVLNACDTLLDNHSGARIVAALAIYTPGHELARAWARWGAKRRDASGLVQSIADAMKAAAERDDLESMPDWTVQVPATRFSFLNALRKKMNSTDWRKVLMLLMRQRAAAGDVAGVGWCLFSYKFEHKDSIALVAAFCDMTVSARQTLLRATRHCTRDEVKLFRPVWAEGLRDASPAVALAALDAVVFNRSRSLKALVLSLKHDAREEVASMAAVVLDSFDAK